MSEIAILFHSGYGHTARVAEAVRAGAAEIAPARLIPISAEGELPEGGWEALAAAPAIVFGTPTYMGGPSWQFKKVADASSKAWAAGAWKNKLAGGFTNSASMNGDKAVTLHYLLTLAMQHGMIWAGTAMMPANSKAARRDDVNWLGGFTGALAQSPADAAPEEMAEGDLETARLYGRRIAELARRLG
ncbi:MAG: flavodoxin family protein [Roseococcus sp.]|nr:flavodoxin family protein [Roseococcus sp.]